MLFSLEKKFFQNFHSLYEKEEICKNSSAKSAYNTGKKSNIEICIFIPVLMMLGAAVVHERKALSHIEIILILFNVNYFIKITKLIILKYCFFCIFY